MSSKSVNLSIISVAIATSVGIFGVIGLPIYEHYQENQKNLQRSSTPISSVIQEKIVRDSVGGDINTKQSSSVDELVGAIAGDAEIKSGVSMTLEDIEQRAMVAQDPAVFYELGRYYERTQSDAAGEQLDAFAWYERAADLGHKEAQYKMGLLFSEDPRLTSMEESFEYFNKSADQGYAPAEIEVANMYAEGVVIPQDYGRAMAYYVRAANKGNADAELNIGQMYQKGLGVGVDMVKAVEYYAQAASKGQAQAQYNLGVAYFFGLGVEKDPWKARTWLNQALINGNKDAVLLLREIVIA